MVAVQREKGIVPLKIEPDSFGYLDGSRPSRIAARALPAPTGGQEWDERVPVECRRLAIHGRPPVGTSTSIPSLLSMCSRPSLASEKFRDSPDVLRHLQAPPRGFLSCGRHIFVAHPPSHWSFSTESGAPAMKLTEFLWRLGKTGGDSDADPAAAPPSQHMQPALTPEEARRGTAELLRRFEAGLFERGNRSLYNRAGGGVCTDMVASASRMSAGAAWRL